ncbi:MAG: DNA-processing protein DprA [Thermoleophilia bacterium]|nr:DNA-processing protein DprA [Thermoleophilia bacterium]
MTDTASSAYFLPPGHRLLPTELDHVTPTFRGLWFAGDPGALVHRPRVGIIGSRHPRPDARDVARRIARDAARAGLVVVSGLAIGIDGIAHQAAIDGGAPTIAVLAGGLARVQPASNRRLARQIAGSATSLGVQEGIHDRAAGLVVSEYGPGTESAHPYRFLERNRIIAALSDYLVVVQARTDSGSMRTASDALALGVQVGVLPSSPDDPCHGGTTSLLRDGADPIVDGTSLLRRMEGHDLLPRGFADAAEHGARLDPSEPRGWSSGDQPAQLVLGDDPVIGRLDVPRTAEEVADHARMPLRDVRLHLLELELDGYVQHRPDGTWARC